MYRECVASAGIPERIYRTPLEIRRDMITISEKIRDTNERLNLRSILLDLVDQSRVVGDNPAVWIPELTEAIDEARSAYQKLNELKDELFALREELREARWAICV